MDSHKFLLVGAVCGVPVAIWALGWLLFDLLKLWQYMTSAEFQNGLLFLAWLGFIIALRVTLRFPQNSTKTSSQTAHKLHFPKSEINTLNQLIRDIKEQMKDLGEKLQDIQSFMKIFERKDEDDIFQVIHENLKEIKSNLISLRLEQQLMPEEKETIKEEQKKRGRAK